MRLARGGFPEANERQADDRRAAWLAAYVSTILQRDVRDLARLDALVALPDLLRLLASRVSGLLRLAAVSRDIGLAHMPRFRSNLSRLLEEVRHGQRVVVTRRGKKVACLVPVTRENLLPSLSEFRDSIQRQGAPLS
ncbi:MAG: type II toxin-antitoxin system prevent-host-death family antitoxin [Thermodesulfobacteriota bacterium]